jgi:(2Fe-2S) ferredoxin
MYPAAGSLRRILVCQGLACSARGSRPLLDRFRSRLAHRREVCVETWWYFSGCPYGPNVLVHPDGVWYEAVQPDDVEDVARHAEFGEPVAAPVDHLVPPTIRTAAFARLGRRYSSTSGLRPVAVVPGARRGGANGGAP